MLDPANSVQSMCCLVDCGYRSHVRWRLCREAYNSRPMHPRSLDVHVHRWSIFSTISCFGLCSSLCTDPGRHTRISAIASRSYAVRAEAINSGINLKLNISNGTCSWLCLSFAFISVLLRSFLCLNIGETTLDDSEVTFQTRRLDIETYFRLKY